MEVMAYPPSSLGGQVTLWAKQKIGAKTDNLAQPLSALERSVNHIIKGGLIFLFSDMHFHTVRRTNLAKSC